MIYVYYHGRGVWRSGDFCGLFPAAGPSTGDQSMLRFKVADCSRRYMIRARGLDWGGEQGHLSFIFKAFFFVIFTPSPFSFEN
jgi:hypothetical protein